MENEIINNEEVMNNAMDICETSKDVNPAMVGLLVVCAAAAGYGMYRLYKIGKKLAKSIADSNKEKREREAIEAEVISFEKN